MIIAADTKETRIKKQIREDVANHIFNHYLSNPNFIGKVNRIEDGVVIAIDDVTMESGEVGEVCAKIKIEVPNYVDKVNKHGETIRAYERLLEADEYEEKQFNNELKAEEKAKKKAEQDRIKKQAKIERMKARLAKLESELK